jgi:methanogenic corrinoid protein MtbC1
MRPVDGQTAAEKPDSALTDRDQLLEALGDALRAVDQLRAMTVVRQALKRGWTVDDVRFFLIRPALYDVGSRWERGEIGVGDEHLATSVCEWLLFALAGRVRRRPTTGLRALVGCSEGEQHVLGARIVAHVLSENGWSVLFLGAATPVPAWAQIVEARRPDVAVLSTTTPGAFDTVAPALAVIKASRPTCRTVVGGQAYLGSDVSAEDLGADLLAVEAGGLPAQLLL